jgi:hypothetical protein
MRLIMRVLILGAIVLVCSVSAFAQYSYGPASYDIERWNEDYSYLKEAGPSDFFDPAKYVPLNESGDVYLSFGGQARYRYDYFNNSNFGAGIQDENGFHLFRLLAHVDAQFGPNFRVFFQAISALEADRSGGPRPGDTDDIDIQQLFADFRVPLDDSRSLTFRVGRQELIYGAQRLISSNDWTNTRRTFDGAKVSLSVPNDTLEAFWVQPVIPIKRKLNSDDDNTSFAGIYNVAALPNLIPSGDTKVDSYFLALNQTRSSTVAVSNDTYTVGGRFHTTPRPWDMDVEADWQFGRFNSERLCAYSIAAEGGYTFSKMALSPRAWLGFDLASGSGSGAHRFNQLFPPQYMYLGHMYVLGRQNLIDLHPGISLSLPHDITLAAEEHVFWRQNSSDSLYNLTGGVVRAADGSKDAYVGNELDLSATWQIQQHLFAYAGWAHFFTGTFIQQTGAHSDMDFLYASVTFTF